MINQFSSVQFSRSVTSGLPVHQQLPEFTQTHLHWIGDAIQPSHLCCPLLLPHQSFPASGSFQMSQFFTSGSQSIGVSASTSVLPMNTQDWFPLGWTGWISLQSEGLSRVFSNITVQKHQFFFFFFKASVLQHSAFFRRRKWQPQCSCLENPRDGGAWWAAVYGVAQSWTRLKRLSSSSSSFIYSPILTSVHDCWKNHSFE